MNNFFYTPLLAMTLCLGVGLVGVAMPVHAIDIPDPKIKDARAVYKDQTAVQIKFKLKNFSENSGKDIKVRYHRQADEYVLKETTTGYTHGNGTYYATIKNLLPDTQYKFRLEISNGSGTTKNGWKKFKTTSTAQLEITDIQPRIVQIGDAITVTGKGFGSGGSVKVGYGYNNTATVSSWSDTKITATVPEGVTDGTVTVEAYQFFNTFYYYALSQTSSMQLDVVNESHIYSIACYPGVIADSYEAVTNFNTLYEAEFGRSILCDELEFHLQHKTPHDRLRTWLNEQVDGKWWDELMQYNDQSIYSADAAYYVRSGKLYRIPDVMTALAWNIDMNEAIYLDDLNVSDHRSIALSQAAPLSIWQGDYYPDVLSMPSQAFSLDNDTCDIMECGLVY